MAAVGKGWDVPAELDSVGDFRWWKLGGNKVLKLVILSHEPTFYRGHYTNRRMVPCFGDGCALCKAGVGAQLRFVFAAAEPETRQVGLIEVGRTVGLEIRDLAKRHGQLRGMGIELTRFSYSKQSRMEVEYVDRDFGNWWGILPVPDCRRALEATWKRAGKGLEEPDGEPATATPGPGWRPGTATLPRRD